MAGTITSYSGGTQIWNVNDNMIDTANLVALETQILEAKKTPLTTIQTRLKNEQTVYNAFKEDLNSFVTFMKDMSKFTGSGKATSVSQTGFVSATASATAISGTFDVSVSQLASRHQISGALLPADLNTSILGSTASDTTIKLNDKEITITKDTTYKQLIDKVNGDSSYGATMYTVGGRLYMASTQTGQAGAISLSGDSTVLQDKLGLQTNTTAIGNTVTKTDAILAAGESDKTIQINGKDFTVTTGMTYEQFVAAVNADSSYGLTMSIGTDGKVTATGTGVTGLVADNSDILTTKLGLVDSTTSQVNFGFSNVISAAADAKYTINGGDELTSSSNTVENIVPGLTLKLENTTTSPIKVTVDNSTATEAIAKIKEMVTSFNSAADVLANYTAEGTKMQGSNIALVTGRALSSISMFEQNGNRLYQYGIEVDKTGRLSIDATKLEAAFQKDPEAAKSFFFSSTTGLAKKMDTELSKIFGETGTLTTTLKSLNEELTDISDKLSDIDAANAVRQEAIVKKYAMFEMQMSALSSQLTYIKALTGSDDDDD